MGILGVSMLAFGDTARAGDETVTAHGLLQIMGTVADQDVDPQADPGGFGDPEADPGLAIHRARIGLDGTRDALDWQVTFGTAQSYDTLIFLPEAFSALSLVSANAGYRFGASPGDGVGIGVRAGLQDVPFAREQLFAVQDLAFLDRGVSTVWLSPQREIGVLADLGTAVGFRARAGIYNGDGDPDGDDNVGKLLVARMEYGQGDGYRTWSPSGEDALSVAASVMSDTDLTTGSVAGNVDALFRRSRTTVLAQGTYAVLTPRNTDVAPPTVLAPINRIGATAQVSYFLPTDDAQDSAEGVEFAARASWFDAASGIMDNGDVLVANIGATWRDVQPGLDVGTSFIHRQELGGNGIPNDTLRVYAQVRARHGLGGGDIGGLPTMSAWRKDFLGTWRANGDLDGALLAFWEQPGLGLVGSFQMNQPRGKVVVGRPYPLDSFMYADRTLRVRMDPYGEGRDVVWFELTPSVDGQLCGYGYEDGKRANAVSGTGGGSWICWTQQSATGGASTATGAPVPGTP